MLADCTNVDHRICIIGLMTIFRVSGFVNPVECHWISMAPLCHQPEIRTLGSTCLCVCMCVFSSQLVWQHNERLIPVCFFLVLFSLVIVTVLHVTKCRSNWMPLLIYSHILKGSIEKLIWPLWKLQADPLTLRILLNCSITVKTGNCIFWPHHLIHSHCLLQRTWPGLCNFLTRLSCLCFSTSHISSVVIMRAALSRASPGWLRDSCQSTLRAK